MPRLRVGCRKCICRWWRPIPYTLLWCAARPWAFPWTCTRTHCVGMSKQNVAVSVRALQLEGIADVASLAQDSMWGGSSAREYVIPACQRGRGANPPAGVQKEQRVFSAHACWCVGDCRLAPPQRMSHHLSDLRVQ